MVRLRRFSLAASADRYSVGAVPDSSLIRRQQNHQIGKSSHLDISTPTDERPSPLAVLSFLPYSQVLRDNRNSLLLNYSVSQNALEFLYEMAMLLAHSLRHANKTRDVS